MYKVVMVFLWVRNLGIADGCTMAIAVRRVQDPIEATLAVPDSDEDCLDVV